MSKRTPSPPAGNGGEGRGAVFGERAGERNQAGEIVHPPQIQATALLAHMHHPPGHMAGQPTHHHPSHQGHHHRGPQQPSNVPGSGYGGGFSSSPQKRPPMEVGNIPPMRGGGVRVQQNSHRPGGNANNNVVGSQNQGMGRGGQNHPVNSSMMHHQHAHYMQMQPNQVSQRQPTAPQQPSPQPPTKSPSPSSAQPRNHNQAPSSQSKQIASRLSGSHGNQRYNQGPAPPNRHAMPMHGPVRPAENQPPPNQPAVRNPGGPVPYNPHGANVNMHAPVGGVGNGPQSGPPGAGIPISGHTNFSQVMTTSPGLELRSQSLKVEDALAYLKQVHTQFTEQPQVYNHFLDIMKDFKEQNIDTSEVIVRVSNLFRGHKELILGFNTFLPPGYKIELNDDPITGQVKAGLTVTLPQGGVSTIPTDGTASVEAVKMEAAWASAQGPMQQQPPQHQNVVQTPPNSQSGGQGPPQGPNQSSQQAPGAALQNAPPRGGSGKFPNVDGPNQQQRPSANARNPGFFRPGSTLPPKATNDVPPSKTSSSFPVHGGGKVQPPGMAMGVQNPPGVLPNAPVGAVASTGKPIEFDQAISYVNRIKKRFVKQDTVYKQFLEVLQAYQKGEKIIREVYDHVATLFKDHKDLLDEFQHFLPDSGNQPPPASAATAAAAVPGTEHAKRGPEVVPAGAPPPKVAKKMNLGFPSGSKPVKRNLVVPAAGALPGGVPGQLDDGKAKKKGSQMAAVAQPQQMPQADVRGGTGAQRIHPPSFAAQQELWFFESIREKLGEAGQDLYHEFIKCLSLFSQEIISRSELLMLTEELFSASAGLFDHFKNFLDSASARGGIQSVEAHAEYMQQNGALLTGRQQVGEGEDQRLGGSPESSSSMLPPSPDRDEQRNRIWAKSIRETAKISKILCSPCFRRLPHNFIQPTCSGRTELERSVLNDVWVCVPPDYHVEKAAEKTHPEKKLFSIEEEMYSMDLSLETIALTRQKLEPLSQSLAENGQEGKRHPLPVGLLNKGTCEVILKVYGEIGAEMLEQVKNSPGEALPIVVHRLREKEQEWQKSRKDFAQAWRVEVMKIYDGYLDHRGTMYQEKEKEKLSTKELLGEAQRKSFICLSFPSAEKLRVQVQTLIKMALEWEIESDFKRNKILQSYESFVVSFLRSGPPAESNSASNPSAPARSFYATEELYMLIRFEQALREKMWDHWNLAGIAASNAEDSSKETLQAEKFDQTIGLLKELLSAGLTTKEYRMRLREVLGDDSYRLYSTSFVFTRLLKLVRRIFSKDLSPSMRLLQLSRDVKLSNISDLNLHLTGYAADGDVIYRMDLANESLEIVTLRRDVEFPPGFEESRERMMRRVDSNWSRSSEWPADFQICNGLDWSVCDDSRLLFVEGTEDAVWKKTVNEEKKRRGENTARNALIGLQSLLSSTSPTFATVH